MAVLVVEDAQRLQGGGDFVGSGKVFSGLVDVFGGGAFVGYVLYVVFRELYTQGSVPLVFKVAVPVALAGVAFLVAAVTRDRLKARGREGLEGVRF